MTRPLPDAGPARDDRIVCPTPGRPPAYLIHPRDRMFQFKAKVELLEDFYYWTGESYNIRQIAIPAGFYDGFSIPPIVQIVSFGQLGPVMAGMAASFVHDTACTQDMGTRKWRRELFKEAYDSSMLQYFPDVDPEAWGSVIKRGVIYGSKYCSAC